MLPRYIISNGKFDERQRVTTAAIAKLDTNSNKVLELLSFTGTDENGIAVPGCIFAVNVRLSKNITGSQDEVLKNFNDKCDLNDLVGYDGQCISDYLQKEISIMSETVLNAIAQSSRKNILSFWGMHEEGLAGMGYVVENLFWQDLQNKYEMKNFPMKNQAEVGPTVSIGECKYLEDVEIDKLREKVFFTETSCVARMTKNAPLIDFAGPSLQVYQVTVSNKHDMSIRGLTELFLSSGHCEMQDGKVVESASAVGIGQIKLYWVVPPGKAAAWKDKTPKTVYGEKIPHVEETTAGKKIFASKALLKVCLRKYMIQYILVMDIDPTIKKEEKKKKKKRPPLRR